MACKRSAVRSRLPPPSTRLQSAVLSGSPSSRGLGHRPFTAVTGVRIPMGTPKLAVQVKVRVVVQSVRIPACHAGVAGSSPVHSAKIKNQLRLVLCPLPKSGPWAARYNPALRFTRARHAIHAAPQHSVALLKLRQATLTLALSLLIAPAFAQLGDNRYFRR